MSVNIGLGFLNILGKNVAVRYIRLYTDVKNIPVMKNEIISEVRALWLFLKKELVFRAEYRQPTLKTNAEEIIADIDSKPYFTELSQINCLKNPEIEFLL